MRIIIINITLLVLVLSVLGQRRGCKHNNNNIVVCKKSDVITRVIHPPERSNIALNLNGDTTIGRHAFKHVNNWQLRLSFPKKGSPHALQLQPGSFVGISYTTNLDIENANITYSGDPWTELENVITFTCKNCGFAEVPTKMLASFPKLEELSFKDHHITSVQANAFVSLTNLKTLNLASDQTIVLEPGSFNGVQQLEDLEISADAFTSKPGVFDHLKQLETLALSGHFQDGVKLEDVLRTIPGLLELRLQHGNVDLHSGIFDDHHQLQLRTMLLVNDQIRHLPKNVFDKFAALEELAFISNGIETIEPLAFSGLNLSSLVCEFENLKAIEPETFHGLTVGILQLTNSDISEIKAKAFNGLKAEVVNLRVNALTEVGTDDFYGMETTMLDLGRNAIRKIASGAFKNTKVEKLVLEKSFGSTISKSDLGLPESVVIELI